MIAVLDNQIGWNIAWNIFATLLHKAGPHGPKKGNAQLTRQNDFSFT